MKMEQTKRSEMLAYKIQTPGNYPEESTQHTGQPLKVYTHTHTHTRTHTHAHTHIPQSHLIFGTASDGHSAGTK